MSSPFPAPTFGEQKISVSIPVPPDLSKFKVRLFIEGTTPASAVNDTFDIYDVALNLNSLAYGNQGPRSVGPEPGVQFGNWAPYSLCQFGEYVRAAGSAFGGSCPDLIKAIDIYLNTWTKVANFAALSGDFIPESAVSPYFIRVNGGQLAIWNNTANVYCTNVADVGFQSYLFDTFFPDVYLPSFGPNAKNGVPVDAAHPTYVTIDAFSTNYAFGSITAPGGGTAVWDSGFPQNRTEWYAGYRAFFKYAVDHCPLIRLAPHIGSMEDPNLPTFQNLYDFVPAIMREPISLSGVAGAGSFERDQIYYQLINCEWFANQAPPLFAGDPQTRVVLWGVDMVESDIHTALGYYCQIRGPNTFNDLRVGSQAVDPALWLPTINKLGGATGSPVAVVGSAGASLMKREFQNGIAYYNIGAGTQSVALPTGATDWNGSTITSVTLPPGRGDVVIIGTPVSVGVRATRTAVIAGSDGTVTNPALAIDKDSNPPVTAATITRTNFSDSTVGSVLELSGFGG